MRLSNSWVGLALLGGTAALLVFHGAGARTWSTLVVVFALFAGLQEYPRSPRSRRVALLSLLAVAALAGCLPLATQVRDNLTTIPEWDFVGFWLYAKIAVAGHNFYDPGEVAEAVSSIQMSRMFYREIIETGFWYPPPTMFLFLPLSWFTAKTALTLWYVVHICVLAIDTFLLWRIFFPGGGRIELAACATLMLVSGGTLTTLEYAQTNFIALLAVLLFWRRPNTFLGGLWVAAAMFVKPLLAVLGAYFVIGAQWRALVGLVATTVVLCLASVAAFGPETVLGYFTSDPLDAKPAWVYTEETNQSLLGVVLRETDTRCRGMGCVTNPIYLAAVMLLGSVTLFLGIRLVRTHAEWTIGLLLLFALLAYPVSQLFYSVLLVPALLLLWRYRVLMVGGEWTMVALGASVHALCNLDGGRATVIGAGLLWVAMVDLGFRLLRERDVAVGRGLRRVVQGPALNGR